jgi:hypothetical protein
MLNNQPGSSSNLTAIEELRRRADGAPRQDTFFDSQDQPPQNWAWIILWRIKDFGPTLDAAGEWCEWATDPDRPNHFRSQAGAEQKIAKRIIELARKIKLGLVELKIEPKYIGYVPGKDETWISD